MDSGKSRSGLKKAFLLIVTLSVILFISLLVFAPLFLKSPSFVTLIEDIATQKIGRPVEIGTISFKAGPVIVIKEIKIEEKGSPFVILPRLEIKISPYGLLRRSISEITISKPKLFLSPGTLKGPEAGESKPSLPFTFKKLSIDDGEVVLRLKKERAFHISSIILSLAEEVYTGKGSLTKGISWRSEATIRDLVFHQGAVEINLKEKPVRLVSRGLYNINDDRMEIEFIHTQLAQLRPWIIRGSFNQVSSGNPDINLTAEGQEIPFHEIRGVIGGTAGAWLDKIDMEGYAKADLSITGDLKSTRIKGALYIKGEKLKSKGIEVKSFEAGIPIEYKKGAYILREAIIGAEETTLSQFNEKNDYRYRLNKIEVVVPYLEYKGATVKSGVFQLRAAKAAIYSDGKDYYSDKGISLKGTLHGNLDSRWLRLKDLSLESDSLKGITGDVSFVMKKPITIETEVEYKNIDIEKLWTRLPRSFLKAEEFSVKGRGALHTAFTVTIPEETLPHISGKTEVRLTDGGFSSSDGAMIAEGIVMDVSNTFELSLPLSQLDFTSRIKAADFELLMGSFYGNFKDSALGLAIEGRYSWPNDSLKITRSELNLTDTGSIALSGEISDLKGFPRFDTEILLRNLSNKRAYELFIRETFQDSFPLLSQLEVDGISSMELSVKGTRERLNISGDIKIIDLDIIAKDSDLSIEGINLSLPVLLSYPDVSLPQEKTRFGSFRVRSFSWGSLRIDDLTVFPALWRNTLGFKEDIVLPIFEGDVTLRNITCHDIISPERNLLLSVDIDGIDLSKVSMALGIPGFSGSLSGAIPKISFKGNSLLTEGEIVLKIFGGEMRASDLSIHNVFSPITSLRSSILLKEIDLNKLTRTFDFGHISGIMQGYVEDLVISNRQAESFKAFIVTAKRKGIPQKISVKALKKISILGSGSSASILDAGIYQFFKEYRYEKIGFKALLRNDNLLLLGVESEGNKEYLVKGGILPPRVDVISYTQNISFQEMLKRLKRINQAEKNQNMDQ